MSIKRKIIIAAVILITALFILLGIKESGAFNVQKKVVIPAQQTASETKEPAKDETLVIVKDAAETELTQEEATAQNLKNVGLDDADVIDVLNALEKLKAYYLFELSDLKDQCIAEYHEKKEKDPNTDKNTVLNGYMPMITSLESDCDSQVADILSGLKSKLVSKGVESKNITDIVRQIENGYVEFKTATLQQYKAEINEAK